MEGDVSVELLEELDPIADQDREDRITNFVGQPETKAVGGEYTASNKPDATEGGPQAPIHELREIARVELDGIPGPRELTMSQNEGRLVAVRPPQAFGLKIQRSLVCSRSHDVAVDRLEERLDESWVHRLPVSEFVGGLEPVDAAIFSSDEAVEARRHVDRYVRISVCHRSILTWSATHRSTARSRFWSESIEQERDKHPAL
jgi:hypothetical protein